MVDETSAEFLAESKVQSIIICNAILITFGGVGMGVRLFVRSRFLSGIGWDDILCLIGYVRSATLEYYIPMSTDHVLLRDFRSSHLWSVWCAF